MIAKAVMTVVMVTCTGMVLQSHKVRYPRRLVRLGREACNWRFRDEDSDTPPSV
jgi:hypothetical protein